MTAEEIKLRLRTYYLWKRRFYFATEEQYLNVGIADVLVWDNNFNLIEVEIKISKSDFSGEMKSINNILFGGDRAKCKKHYKHDRYLKGFNHSMKPHRFYFCVPLELKDYVLEKIKNTPYGLLVVNEGIRSFGDSVSIVKSGKLLHNEKPDKRLIENGFRSLCYENLRLFYENRNLKQVIKNNSLT